MQEPPKTPPMTGKPAGKAAAAKQDDSSEEESSEEEESDEEEEEAPKSVSTLLLQTVQSCWQPCKADPLHTVLALILYTSIYALWT